MDIMEIILLIAGGVIFVLSFFIPDKKGASADGISEEDVRAMIYRELAAGGKSLDEAASEAAERTERSLERLSNEKIMAVNEYSDTVLTEIHKNHEEVMFLYDMLNNKHTSLKNTVAEVNRAVKEAEKAIEALRHQMETAEIESCAQGFPLPQENGKAAAQSEVVGEPAGEAEAASGGDDFSESGEYGSNKEKIRSLHRQGKSVAEIARELELGIGEVKLVIDLFQC